MLQILKYFPSITDTQKKQLTALEPLYADWNAKINVISRKDMGDFYEHHVLHSLAIAKVVQFLPGTSILDLGTGGGFPGIPLAIMFPDVNFLLVDSVGKKLKVVDDIAAKIGLKNVKTIHARAEQIPGQFDFVTSRAVARLDTTWGWVANIISGESNNAIPNGLLYLKGGDVSAEAPAGVGLSRWELKKYYSEPFFAEKALVHLYKKSAQ